MGPDPVMTPPTTARTKAEPSLSASPDITRNVSLPARPTVQTRQSQNEDKTLEQRLRALRNWSSPESASRLTPLPTPVSALASLPPVPISPLQLFRADQSDSDDDGGGGDDNDRSPGESHGWAVALSGAVSMQAQ